MSGQLIVGTEDGLHHLKQQDENWEIVGRFLEGSEINGVAVDQENRALVVATRNNGLQHIDLSSGNTRRLGEGTIPETTRCVAFDPNDANRIYVGAEPTSFFYSHDGGESWNESQQIKELAKARSWEYHVDFIAPHLRYLVVSHANPDHIYGAVQIGGVVRSEDGGETWTDVVEGIDPDTHMIVQDPKDADTIYAVCGGGGFPADHIYPPPFPQGRAIYRSRDRAASWECVSKDLDRTYGVPIQMHPDDPSILVAGLARGWPFDWVERPEHADAAVVLSRDGGENWKTLENGLPSVFTAMVEVIEFDRTNEDRLYVGTGGEAMKLVAEEFRKGHIYYADDVEAEWQRLPIELPSSFTLTSL